jgi:hypothetical protein
MFGFQYAKNRTLALVIFAQDATIEQVSRPMVLANLLTQRSFRRFLISPHD